MRFQQFVDALYKAGWRAPCDAQYSEIRKLHRELFPVVAQLEDDLEGMTAAAESLQNDVYSLQDGA